MEISSINSCDGVLVQNLFFGYNRGSQRPEISNANLCVPRGVIYGLLGPSGCGKTTLLRCIIGRLKPRKGLVRVFDTQPGSRESGIPGPGIGYMPQELALISQFTIKETLSYYAGFCNTDRTIFQKRMHFLLNLLELSHLENKFVDNLSGGQKRRVSLAIALINNPPLLILDEPTVGVDPILRECIWNYLVQISKEGLTVIVTTHYIEEAGSADMVGFMRSGHILAEGNPNNLMDRYCVNSMERLFLLLSRKDECIKQKGSHSLAIDRFVDPTDNCIESQTKLEILLNEPLVCNGNASIVAAVETKELPFPQRHDYYSNRNKEVYTQIEPELEINHFNTRNNNNELINFRTKNKVRSVDRIGVLCNKNRLRLFRRIPELVITMLLPALEVALFALCMGRDPTAVQLAVSNQEKPPILSQIFLQSIDNNFIALKYYSSPETAINSVRNADTYSALIISQNFSMALRNLYRNSDHIDNGTIDDSTIKIYYDGSNALHVNIIRREVFGAIFKFAETVAYTFGEDLSRFKLPVRFEPPIYGSEKADMIEFVGPGLMIFIVFFATMSITSMAFLSERREGTLERSMISGVTSTEFIVSQIINVTLLLITQIALTAVMGFWIFDFPMNGSYILAVLMMFLQGICGMCYGLMLSAICTHEMFALILGAGSQLMFCFITGIFWPVDTMIPLLRYISYLMPQTIPMEAYRHVLIRGFDLSKQAVLNGFLVTGVWIAFFLIAAIVIFKLR